MYCRNCGKEVAEKAEICVACGTSTKKGTKYCQSCGEEASPIKAKVESNVSNIAYSWCTICGSERCANPDLHSKPNQADVVSTKEFCSKCGVRWMIDDSKVKKRTDSAPCCSQFFSADLAFIVSTLGTVGQQ